MTLELPNQTRETGTRRPAGRIAGSAATGMRRLLTATLLGVLTGAVIVSGILLAPAPPSAAQEEIGISGVPGNSEGVADGRSRFTYSADPGEQIVDYYLVRNAGTQPQTFTVLGADAFNDDAGAYALKPTDEDPVDLGTWVQFENGSNRIQFDLQPGESRLVPFTIAVPQNATPGDHAGGIIASVVTPDGQVRVDRRVGTRTYVRVSGDIQVGLSVSKLEGRYTGDWWNPLSGTLKTQYTVENTGNIALAANVKLGVNTWFGIPLDNRAGDSIPELLPGGTRVYETEVSGVAAWGYLNPWVTLSPFVEGNDPEKRLVTEPTTRDAFVLAMPWLLVIAILLAGLVLLLVKWRRAQDRKRAAAWIEYTEGEARRKAEAEAEAAQSAEAPETAGVGVHPGRAGQS